MGIQSQSKVKQCYTLSGAVGIIYLLLDSLLLHHWTDTTSFLFITWHFIIAPILCLFVIWRILTVANKISDYPTRLMSLPSIIVPVLIIFLAATGNFRIVHLLSPPEPKEEIRGTMYSP